MRYTFKIPPGYTSEDGFGQAQNRWKQGSNVRFWQGGTQSIGGWTKMFANPLSGVPRKMLAFNRSGTATMAYGTTTKLYVGTGTAQPTDRSPVGLGSGITAWSLDAWGSTLLASPTGGKLYEQSGSGTATEVTEAPDVITCMLVTPQRQVIAAGTNEVVSGTFNALCVRVSNIEDYSSAGSWTPSATNNSDEVILSGSGSIVAARLIGSFVAIWTDGALHLGQFIGDPSQTYRFDLVDENCGCVGPNAVTVIDGRAWWIRPDLRLMTWAPGELPTAVPSEYHLGLGITTLKGKIIVAPNSHFGEVWVFYPVDLVTESYAYIARNIATGATFTGGISRTAILDEGALASVLGSTYASNIIAADGSGYVYVHETGTTADGSSLNWNITSGAMCRDGFPGRVMLKTYYPNGSGSPGTLTLTVYAASYPADVSQADPVSYTVTGLKKDFRISGRAFSLNFAGTAGSYRLGPPTFDLVEMGER